ncbi:polyphosphate kinase 2 [Rhodoblastus sp.]|jgi:polyphosphate kinase 2|uniref:polyphosphate kinase 2 n=1 Tax=Rhodoblastus sp. TaxID=1962975 RepID=UPI0025DB0B94|nr:polyphosphate kinase 2 [Rhodoblastus sp.]
MTKKNTTEDESYKKALHEAQVELVKFQKHVIENEQKVLVILEGRDAAGKDGAAKRITEHLSPRETRIVALGKPSDIDRKSWYFQRYVPHLPISGEIAIFNRSWYNRAGVERVMGFCTDAEYEQFMHAAPIFEQLLVHCGVTIIKYYLDISREEQERRLDRRRVDPLRQWKISPVDEKAVKRWKLYSEARNDMFARTHSVFAPWIIIKADDKKAARLNIIRDLLSRCEYPGKRHHGELPDPNQVFLFDELALKNGVIAP